jgi:hypothetical protein
MRYRVGVLMSPQDAQPAGLGYCRRRFFSAALYLTPWEYDPPEVFTGRAGLVTTCGQVSHLEIAFDSVKTLDV